MRTFARKVNSNNSISSGFFGVKKRPLARANRLSFGSPSNYRPLCLSRRLLIQPKLVVGAPDDMYEREADRVADEVMRMPASEPGDERDELIQMKSVAAQITPLAQRQVEEEEEELLQTKTAPGRIPAVTPAFESQVQLLRGVGQPLPESTRAFFEARFGHDFSRVRVYADAKAAELASAARARSFTLGRDIVFSAEQYAPETEAGKELLAHELTHVVQQSTGPLETQTADPGRQIVASFIERKPEPPQRNLITQSPDLIKIDSVPDFVASDFTGDRVSAHINHPGVVDILWELYDPNDRKICSEPKQPGRQSVLRQFKIKPSYFPEGFVEGKYILRCIGMNYENDPIVYADRDFSVWRSDLATGTALETHYGKLTFVKYEKSDAKLDDPKPSYFVRARLKFLPNKAVNCKDVTFIQAVQCLDPMGRSLLNEIHDISAKPT